VAGTGGGSTAVALAVAGEIWVSESEANSEMADTVEYEDDGAEAAGIRDAASVGSKDSINEGADATDGGLDVFGPAVSGGEFEFGLAGHAGEAGRASTSAFFQGVDVPHSAQWRRMFPLTA